jgi:hypothetical protein
MKLGIKVRDKITKLEGMLTGKVTYLTGCDQYLVQPQGDGKTYPESTWIDVNRLIKIKGKRLVIKTDVDKGCDISAPKK